MSRRLLRRASASTLALLALGAAPAALAQDGARLSILRLMSHDTRAARGLSLLEDRALVIEYPSPSSFAWIGTQAKSVEVGAGRRDLARTTLGFGFGWKHLKVGVLWDGVALADDAGFFVGGFRSAGGLDGGEVALSGSLIPFFSWPILEDTSITLGFAFNTTRFSTGFARAEDVHPLFRFRLLGYTAQVGLPKAGGQLDLGVFLSGFVIFQTLERTQPTKERGPWTDMLRDFGELELLVHYYGSGNNPFILDLSRENASEVDLGLEWRSGASSPLPVRARFLGAAGGDAGFRRAELELDLPFELLDYRLLGTAAGHTWWKWLIPVVQPISMLGGIGAPGSTLAGLNARVFALRLDDGTHFGFSTAVRLEMFGNNARRVDDRHKDNFLQSAARWYEGDDQQQIRSYLELRVSRNELIGSVGLPFPDATSIGLFYVAETFEKAPVRDEIGGPRFDRLDSLLDGDPSFEEDEDSIRRSLEEERRRAEMKGRVLETRDTAPISKEPPKPADTPPPGALPDTTDRDRDGFADTLDNCVDIPEDPDDFEDFDGCPEPDNDGDGVLDAPDVCPNEPGPAEFSGCPSKPPPSPE